MNSQKAEIRETNAGYSVQSFFSIYLGSYKLLPKNHVLFYGLMSVELAGLPIGGRKTGHL